MFQLALLTQGGISPWILVFVGLMAFFLLIAVFSSYPLRDIITTNRWWRAFISGMSLSCAFAIVQCGYFISSYSNTGTIVSIKYFMLAFCVTWFGCTLVWRLVFVLPSSNYRIAAGGITLAGLLWLQMLICIADGSVAAVTPSYLVASLIFTSCLFIIAFILTFSLINKKIYYQLVKIVGAAFCVLTAIFTTHFTFNHAVVFSTDEAAAIMTLGWHEIVMAAVAMSAFCFISQQALRLTQLLHIEQQTNQTLTNLTNGIVDAIIGFNAQGEIVFYNQATKQLFGWEGKQMVGQDILCLASESHRDFLALFIKRLIKKNAQSVIGMQQEFSAQSEQNGQFPARIAIGNYSHANQVCFVASITNMQDLHEQISSQKHQVREYQSLISNLPCITFRELTQIQPHWVYLSENAKVLTSLSASELMTKIGAAQFVDNIWLEDKKAYHQARDLAKKSLGYYDVKYRYQLANKEVRWLWEIGYCYRAKDSTVWADGMILDISHKQEHHQIDKNNTNFDLSQLTFTFFEQVQSQVESTPITFDYSYSDALPKHYSGDPLLVSEILQGILNVTTSLINRGKVAFSILPFPQGVRFAVEINAYEGLNSTSKQRLFEPLDNQLISQARGELWFDFHQQGALLYVDLPLVGLFERKTTELATRDLVYSAMSIDAIVIDDVVKNQRELNDIFWRQGIKLNALFNIELAKTQLADLKPQILLIDVYLEPNFDLDEIRALTGDEVTMVAMIFSCDEQDHWKNKGFDAVIKKPFNAAAIMQEIAPFIEGQAEKKQVQQVNNIILESHVLQQRWRSFDTLFWVIKAFFVNFADLAQNIEQSELDDKFIARYQQAKDACIILGFSKLAGLLTQSIKLIEARAKASLLEQAFELNLCVEQSLEAALAMLGIRWEVLMNEAMPRNQEHFNEYVDARNYQELLPLLLSQFPLTSLAQLIDAIEANEFERAHSQLMRIMAQYQINSVVA